LVGVRVARSDGCLILLLFELDVGQHELVRFLLKVDEVLVGYDQVGVLPIVSLEDPNDDLFVGLESGQDIITHLKLWKPEHTVLKDKFISEVLQHSMYTPSIVLENGMEHYVLLTDSLPDVGQSQVIPLDQGYRGWVGNSEFILESPVTCFC
jgi:hypothetical protein